MRHLNWGQVGDFNDIQKFDWPSIQPGLTNALYGENDPLPVAVKDLSDLAHTQPAGPVTTKLHWDRLSEEDFERLVYNLISESKGYENPQWLTRTNAPDRGRDLSVTRVSHDPLSGTQQRRVIIQCKHWLTKSIGGGEVTESRDKMELWQPPKVDVLIIATSGRFTTDAIALIERHNQSDRALQIEMWPESHLERLLAARPALIAGFNLR